MDGRGVTMVRGAVSLTLIALLGVAGFAGYRLLRSDIALGIYQARLGDLSRDYEKLRAQYDEVVRKTAVTELVVRDGQLRVSIRTAAGEIQTLESPFDPAKEIYVDYVLVDGRLWIRRLFDEDTPPGEGMVIDPSFVDLDWSDDGAAHGKAAYRQLGEGRWVVTVTGDGSLGLARHDSATPVELSGPPPVRSYAPVEEEVEAVLRDLEPREVLRSLARHLEFAS
jgi:hypothetical protein